MSVSDVWHASFDSMDMLAGSLIRLLVAQSGSLILSLAVNSVWFNTLHKIMETVSDVTYAHDHK